MKTTDYALRAAAMDNFLMGKNNLFGAEIGVDVGAHAEAMLTYLNIDRLVLIDVWKNMWVKGYCEGRLHNWKSKTQFILETSWAAAMEFQDGMFDFIYIDIEHDYKTVMGSLENWFPKVKQGGILGYRNYSTCQKAIDEFVQANNIKFEVDKYHNEIILWK